MKSKLLTLTFFLIGIITNYAQTQSYDLNWFTGIGSNVDLTIEENDTVEWTWTSPSHTVENDPSGSSVESFDSGFLEPNGSVFSHTFTVVGSNDYYCSVHGATSMSGTITVVAEGTLSTTDFTLNNFSIYPNPSINYINLKLPGSISEASINIYDILGKRLLSKVIDNDEKIDTSNLKNGMYLLEVSSLGKTKTKRFIKL